MSRANYSFPARWSAVKYFLGSYLLVFLEYEATPSRAEADAAENNRLAASARANEQAAAAAAVEEEARVAEEAAVRAAAEEAAVHMAAEEAKAAGAARAAQAAQEEKQQAIELASPKSKPKSKSKSPGPGRSPKSPKTKEMKLVLMGDSRVGKSSLVRRLLAEVGTIDGGGDAVQLIPYKPTVGMEHHKLMLTLGDEQIGQQTFKLQAWDRAGQKTYGAIVKAYYKRVAGAMLVYDCSDEKTFETVNT